MLIIIEKIHNRNRLKAFCCDCTLHGPPGTGGWFQTTLTEKQIGWKLFEDDDDKSYESYNRDETFCDCEEGFVSVAFWTFDTRFAVL